MAVQLNAIQIAELAWKAGWRGNDLIDAIWTAGIESGYRADAVSKTGCCGIWQLCPCVTMDPQGNANAAYAKWKAAGNSFQPDWWRYDGGRSNPNYQGFFDQAKVAAAPYLSGSSNPAGPNPPSIPNPTDALTNAVQGIFKSWQQQAVRVFLVMLGVIVVVWGVLFLVFDDLKPLLKEAPEIAALG